MNGTEGKSEGKKQSQRQRFIETAKEVEADESGDAFEVAFSKIVPTKRHIDKKQSD